MSDVNEGPRFDAVKPRIFQIGLNKCGTRSIYDFLNQSGIKSVHFKRGELARVMKENLDNGAPPLQDIDRWTAYTDMQRVKKTGVIEACEYYRTLAEYYPRSYFILNTRSKDRWIQSRLKHGTNQQYGERYRKGLGLNSIEETIDAWSNSWDKHHAEVPAFFAQTGQHFLIYDIENDTPDKLSDFLAPDFRTDPKLFGHEGKTDPKPDKPSGAETPANPPVSQSPAAPMQVEASTPTAPVSDRLGKRFTPRNDIVSFDETELKPAFTEASPKPLAEGSTGNVIIACMKNEGPFLLEWIAFHRAIGFHHFLIYTNDCSDGTDVLLDRLAEMGILTHIDNSNWKGNSPQVSALNAAIKHPVAKNAEWLVHIDADEFINIRTGNGTFDCLLKALPKDITNIAMTWRMFGSAGVNAYEDATVLKQFDRCAPAYMPKPHTAWGTKTAILNIGAYGKISCHRPNKLVDEFADKVKWVNGSGLDITGARAEKGWRSDTKTIGYDLVQLNHYALRSSDSFLVKRQRGRALHVDRSIGLNYWMRMDWNTYHDVTIQRNLPRLTAELERLMSDEKVAQRHGEAVSWHRDKIASLKEIPEFSELMESVRSMELDDTARVLAVLEADVES